MPDTIYDVAVVGAGVAGLAAASALEAEGKTVCVVEARNRIGGRVHTVHDPRWDRPAELGAEFVHGHPPQTLGLLADKKLIAADETWWRNEGQGLRRDDEAWEKLSAIFRALASQSGATDVTFEEALSRLDPEIATEADRAFALAYVEGFEAALPEKVSLQALLRDASASDTAFRLPGGYDQLPEKLYAKLAHPIETVHLNHVVKAIDWDPGLVRLHLKSPLGFALPDVRAHALVLTLPIGVWKAEAVTFNPRLVDKTEALRGLEMGQALRVSLRFRRTFWKTKARRADRRARGVPDLGFASDLRCAFPTWWTWAPDEAPQITGWAGGPRAIRLGYLTRAEILEEAVQSLARVLSVSQARVEAELEAWHFHDWGRDPYSLGAYSFLNKNGRAAQQRFAEPIADTLFFAGEATDTNGQSGTVEGALVSGRRVAREISEAFRRTTAVGA